MKLDSRKKNTCDRIMCSKSFETQEMREIIRKEAGESRGFPSYGWEYDIIQMGRKECKDQKRLKMCRRKSMPEQGRCCSIGLATLSEAATTC